MVCRAETSPTTSTSEAPAANTTKTVAPADVKIQTTLSSLDALLGAPPAATTSPTKEPATSSTATAKPQQPPQASWPLPSATSTAKPASPTARKAQASFESVMGFSGLAPEVINGRAAMIGFVCAFGAELRAGESVFSQMVSGGFVQMLVVILAITVASFAPAVRQVPWDKMFGKDKTPAEFGPFTATAEIINGRAAMLGIAIIMFFEGAGNSAFFL